LTFLGKAAATGPDPRQVDTLSGSRYRDQSPPNHRSLKRLINPRVARTFRIFHYSGTFVPSWSARGSVIMVGNPGPPRISACTAGPVVQNSPASAMPGARRTQLQKVTSGKEQMAGQFELFMDEESKVRFRIIGPDGTVLALSRSFPDTRAAAAGVEAMRESAGTGLITNLCPAAQGVQSAQGQNSVGSQTTKRGHGVATAPRTSAPRTSAATTAATTAAPRPALTHIARTGRAA
jgi:uncharacterized protein YegP (UPF0339 family)